MTFNPNLSVKEGLDHLAKRLDPIIASRLASELGGHPWTVVLDILDQKKGFASNYKHWPYDLQAQLRMLTERLGDLGYPFDDKQRTISTLGSELRIVRNQLAHMHAFDIEEAFRANDFCLRVLEYFSDQAGADEARRIRHEALAAFAALEGVAEQEADSYLVTPLPAEAEALSDHEDDKEAELVVPAPEVLTREPTVIGAGRLEFEPWSVVRVGSVEVLDDLPKKVAKEKVRAVAVEIATYEGPIHLDRLVQLTAQSFGLQRVRTGRERKLAYQIRQSGLFVDSDGFVWPREIDPGSWFEFRPNDSAAGRWFVHISPVEIANAARFLRAQHPRASDEALDAAVLQTFGRKRRSKSTSAHLARARKLL